MNSENLSSRERMLAAITCRNTDYIPCSFMIFMGLRARCPDYVAFVESQLALGLDARVDISDLLIRFHPAVTVKQWKEKTAGHPRLHKEYHTPAGTLRTVVSQSEDWPYGDQVPFLDDYLAPRSEKFLITGPADLPALRYLLIEPSSEVIEEYRARARQAKVFAESRRLLLCGGGCNFERLDVREIGHDAACVGIDALMWLCGAESPLIWAYEAPDFLEELIDVIARWNRRRMEITFDAGVDLIIKRGWYEGTEFWSPVLWRRFIAPVLAEDIRMAHQAGVKFGYIITSGMMDILDDLLRAGPDVIIGIDPVQGKGTTLEETAEKAGGRVGLWGGVNGCLTVEQGTPREVRTAVEQAMAILGARPGFILSPVDNVREWNPTIEANVKVFIETWQANRSRRQWVEKV